MKNLFLLMLALAFTGTLSAQCIKGDKTLLTGPSYLFAVPVEAGSSSCCFTWTGTPNIAISAGPSENIVTVTPLYEGPFTIFVSGTINGVAFSCKKTGNVYCPICSVDFMKMKDDKIQNMITPVQDYLKIPTYMNREGRTEYEC